MLEPLRRRLELIFLFELFERRIVEQPHALIRAHRQDGYQHAGKRDQN